MSCLHRVSADPGCSADLPQRLKTEPWLTEVVLKQQGTQESPGNLSTCRFPGRGVQVYNKLPGIPMQGPLGSTDLHGVKCALRHHASQAGLSRSPADTPHATLGIRPCTELRLDP